MFEAGKREKISQDHACHARQDRARHSHPQLDQNKGPTQAHHPLKDEVDCQQIERVNSLNASASRPQWNVKSGAKTQQSDQYGIRQIQIGRNHIARENQQHTNSDSKHPGATMQT